MWQHTLALHSFLGVNIVQTHPSCLSIHQLVEIWVSVFWLLRIRLFWDSFTSFPFRLHLFSFLLGIYIHVGMGSLGPVVTLTFEKLTNGFPKWMHHFTFFATRVENLKFSTFSLVLVTLCLFDKSHLLVHMKWYLMVVWVWWCWAAFQVLTGHLYVFFGEMST